MYRTSGSFVGRLSRKVYVRNCQNPGIRRLKARNDSFPTEMTIIPHLPSRAAPRLRPRKSADLPNPYISRLPPTMTANPSFTPATFKPILEHLINDPKSFTHEETYQAFHHLAQPDFAGATAVQIGAFLMALKYSGRAHAPDVIASAADVMRSYSAPVKWEGGAPEGFIVDVVGTGGDGYNTFNISTAAAIVAAGAGARVCKVNTTRSIYTCFLICLQHGSPAATSSTGSSDLFGALNCSLPGPTASAIPSNLKFSFLTASLYQPAISQLSVVRKSLPFRTIFNVLGPLLNPANPQGMVLGVYSKELGPAFAHALKQSGRVKRALIVCGQEGLDEISLSGGTWVWEIRDGEIQKPSVIHPAMFGIEARPLSEVIGSTPDVNAGILEGLLNQKQGVTLPEGTKMESIKDMVCMNASALLVVAGLADSWEQGVKLANESIESGQAWKAFTEFRDWTSTA